ncbi:MAG: AIR synthase family protein [Lachnospiraceae bacterium]|nr:AIR synthase family protein [Lachnospiraceae bacterium]MEE1342277.1 AIR synthase family protein [Lachnospiraceae bacterium]
MKVGKVPEIVLSRSVLNQLKTKRDEVLVGASIGEDCAIVALKEDEEFVISTDPITGTTKDIGTLAVHVTANDLASNGAEPIGIMVTVLLPNPSSEKTLKNIMEQLQQACSAMNIQIMGGHTEVTDAVNQPVLSITGVGKAKKNQRITTKGAKPGQEIIVTKSIGIEGTYIMATEKEEELSTRYSKEFIEQAKEMKNQLSIVKEAMIAKEYNVTSMHDITEGGIFGALWEVGEASEVGMEIQLSKIPIKQETIEFCNYFDLNPYMLISSGSLLIVADRGNDVVDALKAKGIEATIIGKIVEDKERVVILEEEKRFLTPPKSDEIYKIWE